MDHINLEAPRVADQQALLIGGLCERYTMGNTGGIPAQWERFSRYLGSVPGTKDGPAYGVCFNFADNQFDYLCGVEVESAAGLPREFGHVDIPAQRYAVFTVNENISMIQRVIRSIWSEWLPASGHKAAHAPVVECYRENFDPHTGDGGFEIWVPVAG